MTSPLPADTPGFNAARRQDEPIGRAMAFALIVVVGVGSGLALASAVALSPLLLSMTEQYNTSLSGVTWTLTIAGLAAALASVILPRLADSRGDKRILVFGTATMVVGALVCALSDGLLGLIVGQALTGFGSIASFSGVTMIRRHLQDSYVAYAVAGLTVGSGVGLAVGYVAGGLALQYLSLEGFFWINAAVYAAFLLALVLLVPKDRAENTDRTTPVGARGTMILGTWLVLLLLTFAKGPEWGWLEWHTLLIGAAAVLIAVIWFFHERRSTVPVFEPSLIKDPTVVGVMIGIFFLNAAFYIWLILAPTYLQMTPEHGGYGLGLSPLQTGIAMLPEGAAFVIGVVLATRALNRGFGVLWTGLGALTAAAGLIALAFLQTSLWEIMIGFALFGFGFGTFGASAVGVLQMSVSEERAGEAMSLSAVTSSLGAGFGGPIATVVLASFLLADGATPSSAAYLPAYIVAAVLAIIGGITALGAYRRHHRQAAQRST